MKYFGCDCKHEIIGVESYEDFVWFAMYEFKGGNFSLKARLRYAFNAIFKGDYTPDEVLLNVEDAQALGSYLLELAREIHEKSNERKRVEEKRADPDPANPARQLFFPMGAKEIEEEGIE